MKYIKKIEGVGDKYAEKKFFMKDPGKEFNFDYEIYLQKMKPVAYIKSKGKVEKDIAIFKNPKSLNMFESNVRAIGTRDGDLFVAQGDYYFYHQNMGAALGFGRVSQIYHMTDNLVFLYRDEASNSFHIGEVTNLFNKKNKKNSKTTESILRAVKRKNSKYDFYNSYGVFSGSKPISLVESKPKNVFGKLKDLMFENSKVFELDKKFTKGDHIICINDTNQSVLKKYQEYVVSEYVSATSFNIEVEDMYQDNKGTWGKFRFIHVDDLEYWELKNTTDKYNL